MKKSLNNRSRSFMIGLTTVATLLMFYFGFNFLKGLNIFDKSDLYYITFDNLQGLGLSSKVMLNGYKVGNVREIDFDYTGREGAILTVALNRNLEIPQGTEAFIKANPLGGASVILNIPDFETALLNQKDTIVGVSSEDVMDQLNNKILPSINNATLSLDTLLRSVNALVNDPAIKGTLDEVKDSATAIKSSTQRIDRMLAKEMPTILDNIDTSTQAIAEMTTKVNEAELEQMLTNLTSTVDELKGFVVKLNSNEGSIGQLINDPELYNRFIKTTHSVDSLLIDIKANPKRYVHFSLF